MNALDELPALSESELRAHFGADSAAIRRYRVVRAVVNEQLRHTDAATRYGVAERTVRAFLARYRRRGLDGLRTRQRGLRAPLAVRILGELRDDLPYASGAQLWRAAQGTLQTTGTTVSRRTAYRILARLARPLRRAVAHRELRAALGCLAEDPPFSLGTTQLAAALLPELRRPLARGLRLRSVLLAAIAALEPRRTVRPGAATHQQAHALIVGEYVEGHPRHVMERQLALSTSAYTRTKLLALERLSVLLPELLSASETEANES